MSIDQNGIDDTLFQKRLIQERSEIDQAQSINQEARNVVELDPSTQGRLSRMDAIERQAIAQATHRRNQLRIQQIDAALARIANGEFGICMDCGEDIEDMRLQAEPCVIKCTECTRS